MCKTMERAKTKIFFDNELNKSFEFVFSGRSSTQEKKHVVLATGRSLSCDSTDFSCLF